MEEKQLNLSDPGVFEALRDDDAMRAWYYLRASPEPMAAAAVASGLGLDLEPAHRALDLLEHARMVRKLPARGSRRAISYEVAMQELVIEIPDRDDGDPRSIELQATLSRRDRELLERTKRFRQSGKGEWFFEQVTDFAPTREEMYELQRRVYEVSRMVVAIADRVGRPSEPVDPPARHVLQLRIAAVDGEIAPFPLIRMLTSRAARQQQRGRVAAPESLAARERDIAKLLQAGLSRAEVAARLGISPQTVSSYCKRLFEKLAIRRATELARFSFDHLPAKPARRKRSARPPSTDASGTA